MLQFRGADSRGTMFAVYDFIERYLGVAPMQFWNSLPDPRKAELAWEKVEIRQGSPTVTVPRLVHQRRGPAHQVA